MGVTVRTRPLKSGRKSVFLDIYIEGRRRNEMLGVYLTGDRDHDREVMDFAELVKARRTLEIRDGRYGLTPAFKRNACFVSFFRELTAAKTDRNWKSAQNYLVRFAPNGISVGSVDEVWLEGLQRFLSNSGLKPNTAHLYYSKVKAALAEAVRLKYIPSNPAKRARSMKREDTEIVFLEHDELKTLYATKCRNEGVKRAFLFSCQTGLRVSDVRSLRWKNVKGARLHFEQRKTRDRRYPPLSDQAVRLMGPAGDAEELVFDLPLAQSSVNDIIRDWVERAGIEKRVTYHSSRHTFATLQLTYGTDIYTVSDLCGHRELRSTRVYAKVVNSKREEAVARVPPIDV